MRERLVTGEVEAILGATEIESHPEARFAAKVIRNHGYWLSQHGSSVALKVSPAPTSSSQDIDMETNWPGDNFESLA
ncbi:hypothetical protein ACFLZP_04465, partial [Patescibacteria group bacterium]